LPCQHISFSKLESIVVTMGQLPCLYCHEAHDKLLPWQMMSCMYVCSICVGCLNCPEYS